MPQIMIELLLWGNHNDFFPLKLKLGCISEKLWLHFHFYYAQKPKQKESLKFGVTEANILHDGNDKKKIVFSRPL